MRLIDADALIKNITRADCVGGWNPIIQLIDYAPTIEAHLSEEWSSLFEYSECRESNIDTMGFDHEVLNFCPYCGAKIERGADDDCI